MLTITWIWVFENCQHLCCILNREYLPCAARTCSYQLQLITDLFLIFQVNLPVELSFLHNYLIKFAARPCAELYNSVVPGKQIFHKKSSTCIILQYQISVHRIQSFYFTPSNIKKQIQHIDSKDWIINWDYLRAYQTTWYVLHLKNVYLIESSFHYKMLMVFKLLIKKPYRETLCMPMLANSLIWNFNPDIRVLIPVPKMWLNRYCFDNVLSV